MNPKLEVLLNLALETPQEEREQTDTLNIGFNSQNRTWELIVKYNGSLDALESLGVEIEYLIAGYAILTVPQQLVELVSKLPEIEYVEKPKRYFYSQIGPTEDSCIVQVTSREPFLNGQGVLLAILDSGIDYRRKDFRDTNGDTRIRYLWDQTLRATDGQRAPEGFRIGVEFTAEQINRALVAEDDGQRYELVPSMDVSGHGTAVAGIAAASTSASYGGVATGAELLIVKLGIPDTDGFPRTTEIMRGVTYALRKAAELGMPLVINLSFGNNYGSHDGSSLLERFLDNAAEIGRTVICVGAGNEGNSAGHFVGNVANERSVELAVAEYEQTLSVQFWKNYSDVYRLTLRSPSGQEAQLSTAIEGGKYTLDLEQTRILVYLGEPSPYAVAQEIYLDMI
ncbi:MAG: peptidase S8, partial [Lachnospiraceae bacterium]|nr:peptidase S8 [Lachnospiraceae bacterium]